MWPRISWILYLLTELTGKVKLNWTERHTKASKSIKAVIIQELLIGYPDHNKPFKVFTDVSDYQISVCVMQDGRPVAYHSKKLNSAQHNYSTMEIKLISVVYTLQ